VQFFENSGSHCEVIRDTTADILERGHLNRAVLGDNVRDTRPWMHQEPVEAFERHWARCFPTFYDDWNNNWTQDEKNNFTNDDVRSLVPEETW